VRGSSPVIRIAISAEAYAAIASILPPGANIGPLAIARPTAITVSGCYGPLSASVTCPAAEPLHSDDGARDALIGPGGTRRAWKAP
jgi:hypothetical protein